MKKYFPACFVLLYWPLHLLIYFLADSIPVSQCHNVTGQLDLLIPFVPAFVLIYLSWFVWIAVTVIFTLTQDRTLMVKLHMEFSLVDIISYACYLIYPTVQYLRPDLSSANGIFEKMLQLFYTIDTPTQVCPSEHVAFAVILAWTWIELSCNSRTGRESSMLLALMISLSTLFVKQHTILDVALGISVGFIAIAVVNGHIGRDISEKFRETIRDHWGRPLHWHL